MKDVSQKREVGDGRITEGWIWQVGARGNMSDEEQDAFTKESEIHQPLSNFLLKGGLADRVQWFRTHTDMEQWVKEVEILEEEFRRCVRACDTMLKTWIFMAAALTKVGYAAYVRQKADMFHKMAEDTRKQFESAKGT